MDHQVATVACNCKSIIEQVKSQPLSTVSFILSNSLTRVMLHSDIERSMQNRIVTVKKHEMSPVSRRSTMFGSLGQTFDLHHTDGARDGVDPE